MTLWLYATAVWGRPDVEAVCLDLQDAHGQSPPLLLWRLWAIARRRSIDVAAIEHAVAAARRWDHAVTGPLRASRRGLKSALPAIAAAVRADLHDRVGVVELEAERALLDALEELTPQTGESADDRLSALVELAAIWGAPAPIATLQRLVEASLPSPERP